LGLGGFPPILLMKPATRSSSGAAMEGRKGVGKGGSKACAAGSGRGFQQQAGTNLRQPPREVISRSTMVPARDPSGRFSRGGSQSEVVDPIPVQLRGAVDEQADAVGDLDVAEEDSVDDEGSFEEGFEVGGHESVGCDRLSSSDDSDFVVDKDEALLEKSVLSKPVDALLAHQLLDTLPQSNPGVIGEKLGGDLRQHTVGPGDGVPVGSSVPPVGGVHRAPWVSLFKDNRNLSKGILLEEKIVEGDIVSLEEEDVDAVEEAWGFCLVGLFAGKFPGWAAVGKLKEEWRVNCTQWRHRSGWLVFKFQSDEDRLKVLNGGPYFAYGSNLMLKILPSCFRFEGVDISSVPIWIQLPGLPLDCWNARALSKIVSKVGKPITTDKLTRTKERLSFARVLVEVDVSTEVVTDVEIRLPTGDVYHQLVISEFTPKFCSRCKSFGHVVDSCGKVSEGGQHRPYVAGKNGPLVGGGKAGPGASKSVVRPADATEEEARVGDGAVRPVHSVRPAVAWMPPWPVQPDARPSADGVGDSAGQGKGVGATPKVQPATRPSADGVGDSAGQGKGMGATASKGKEVLEPGHPLVVEDSRQGPVCLGIQTGSSVQGDSTIGRKGKKKKKKSGKGDVLHDQSEGDDPLLGGYPFEGLEECLEAGIIGGKKGRRKR